MPEYNLAGLSTRSFEQLIQSLAAKVIGPNVVIFGDGRDGGREATFDGPIPYPSREHGWRGYGVVQAKFKQKPEDSSRDGEWALRQLEADLKKFVDPERKLRRPQYYIFATNVVLTPVADSGSKDKARALFEKYAADLDLKGYAIWDYDTIRTFLDDHEEIRRAYAAWITAGDVLAEVMRWFKPRRPDFERVIRRFLQTELESDQYAKLGQAGSASEDRIPLARVFIDLPTAAERKSESPVEQVQHDRLPSGFVAEVVGAAAERLDPQTLHAWRDGRGASERELRLPGRFVLVGGPGQGKTTVGQFICQLFRAALLHDMAAHLLSDDVRQTLPHIKQQCQREGIALPMTRRFPVRVVLNDFAARLDPHHQAHVGSLLEFIVAQIRKQSRSDLEIEDFRDWLGAYPWLLVLDGLDEVPASSNRAAVLDAIKAFWIDAADCNADLLVIATTRPQGYNDDFSPAQYQHRWLLPLSKARALHYAGRFAELRYARNAERQEKIVSRLQRASTNEATSRLMGSPLQVTIMAVLVDQMGQPPQDRWSLFRSYYEVIYRRELERDIPASDILRQYKTDIEAIHRRVGLLLQLESERAGGTDARLSAQRFAALVNARLSDEGYAEDALRSLSQQIIAAATERLVFLVGLAEDQVGFEIRSLQEFMAAEALMDGDDHQVEDRLEVIAPVTSWRNVFLFSAGRCFGERERLRHRILSIGNRLNDDPDDAISHVTLSGSQLALDLLEDGPARSKPGFAPSFARLALRLLDLPHDTYHLRLADVYDESFAQVYREELEPRIAAGGVGQSSGSWACLILLVEKGIVWAEELANRHWAEVARHYVAVLLWLIDRQRGGAWTVERLVEVTPQVSPLDLQLNSYILYIARETKTPLPDWFFSAINIVERATRWGDSSDEYVPLELPGFEGDDALIEFNSIFLTDWHARRDDKLWGMPHPIGPWMPLVAAARFIEAPSQKTLAQALWDIAQYWSYRSVDWVIQNAPWPLSACVAAVGDAQQLLKLADRAEAGELGDLEDWEAAESRWAEQPLTVADIEWMTDERWPFDRTIAQQGYPFGAITSTATLGTRLMQPLFDLHKRLPQSHMRSEVVGWILHVLSVIQTDALPDVPHTHIHALLDEPLPAHHFLNLASVLIQQDLLGVQSIDMVDQLGRRLEHDSLRRSTKLTHWLAQAFTAHPTYLGLLRLLASTVLSGATPNIPPALVDPARYDQPRFREAATIVRVALGFAAQDDAIHLAPYVAELAQTNATRVIALLQATRKHRLTIVYNDHFLLELLRRTSRSEWMLMERIVSELNDALRQRTSRLHDRAVWERLGLPSGLSAI